MQENVPLKRETRINGLKGLTYAQKEPFTPPVGMTFEMGPLIFRVKKRSIQKMKFTAELYDVVTEGK